MAIVVVLVCLVAASCGGTGSPPTTPALPSNPNTVTLTAAGVAPKELTVAPGTRVMFMNKDSRRHDMTSDPHPEHSDCPAINAVGLLSPGQNRETGNLVEVRQCGFHDHDNPDNASLKGRIVVR